MWGEEREEKGEGIGHPEQEPTATFFSRHFLAVAFSFETVMIHMYIGVFSVVRRSTSAWRKESLLDVAVMCFDTVEAVNFRRSRFEIVVRDRLAKRSAGAYKQTRQQQRILVLA